jgi:hypothetical protein
MNAPQNPWFILLKNVLVIGAITSTFMYGNRVWLIIKQLFTPEGIKLLMKDIYLKTL